MSIDEIKPRQLAPSVGIGAADCAVVTVPTRSIYNSAATENHLLFGAFDFTAHSPATMKDFEPVGDGLEILFGSFCFQVGQTGTLRLPERVPMPSIRPASWAPHPVLRTSPSTNEFYSSSSCNSDLCDPPSNEGTYGSGSESCGSSQPICRRYLCVAVIQTDEETPNPPPNPNPQDRNGENGENSGHLIQPSKEGWVEARRAIAGEIVLPLDSPRDLLRAYHYLLIEEHKKQVEMQKKLDKRKQAASESSARRAALSAMEPVSSTNRNQGNKHRSRVE